MKTPKIILILIVAFVCLVVLICTSFNIKDYIPGMFDPYEGERPTDYIFSKWVSEDPDMWFEINPVYNEENECISVNAVGELVYNEEIMAISLHFNQYGSRQVDVFDSDNGGRVFRGFCDFGKKELVVEVDEESEIFKKSTITFKRTGEGTQGTVLCVDG